MSSLPEGEWAFVVSQRWMTQDKVKFVWQNASPWKTDIFLSGMVEHRVELFTEAWVSWCWVTKKDDAENEKDDYKTDEENRKGKYKSCLMELQFDHYQWVKTYKVSCEFLIMSWVPCSDPCLILKKKRKKERSNALFYFLFYDLWSNAVHTISKLQTSKER